MRQGDPALTGRARVALIVALLGVVLAFSPVHAGVSPFWQELGSSATGDGVSQTPAPKAVFDTSVAVDADGRPIVVYAEFADGSATQGAIVVKRWTGAAWETLGAAVGQGYLPQVRLSASGEIFVAWLHDDVDGNSEIHLRTFDGVAFVELGGSDSAGGITGTNPGITSPFLLAVGADGQPVVAFLAAAVTGVVDVTSTPAIVDGTLQVYVRRWNGSTWEFLGTDFTGGGASNAVSFDSAIGGVLHSVDTPALALDGTVPVVAFAYVTQVGDAIVPNTDVYVTRWNGTAWEAVGPAVPSSDGATGRGGAGGVSDSDTASLNPSIAAATSIAGVPGGSLALAWEETSPDGTASYVWVRVWNGTAWVELAASATDSGFTDPFTHNGAPQIAVGPDGRPVVAWNALTPASAAAQIFVTRWNGTDAWIEPAYHSWSDGGVSDAAVEAFAPALALTPSGGAATTGVPTVAWLDARDAGSAQVFLRQLFVGTTSPLTVGVSGAGTVSSNPIGLECAGGVCAADFPSGTRVTLGATPTSPATFGGWSGGCAGALGCAVTLDQAQSVNASFVGGPVTLGIVVDGSGGRVTTNVGGVRCRSACTADFTTGTKVTLTATADTGSTFLGWGDACGSRGTATTCSLTLSDFTFVTASFLLRKQKVTVSTLGAGHVTGDGPIDCATGSGGHTACTAEYDYGTIVELTPLPDVDNRLVSWSGCTSLTGTTCNARLTTNLSVKATFGAARTLSLSASGNGSGKITANTSPALVCTGNCSVSQLVAGNTSVTLTPAPAVGTTFRWLTPPGDVCTGSSTCTVKMNANQSKSGSFTLNRYSLNVTSRTNGNAVTVGALADSIDCGSGGVDKCNATFDYSTTPVLLQATPIPGSVFVSWTGCTSTSGANCSIAMTANRTVAPTYRDVTRVSLAKTGAGSVASSPAGLSCGATCSSAQFDFSRGTPVKLTATTPTGWDFNGFTGDCSGTGPCSLNTSATLAFTVAANFSIQYRRLSVTVVGSGSVTVAGSNSVTGPSGFTCDDASTPCGQDLSYGTVATLTPVAASGFKFTGWSQDCTGTSSTTCKPTMTANHSVTATFKQVFGVTVTRQGNATPGTISATGIRCGVDCTEDYLSGTVVTFSRAAPPVGRTFRWLGDCAFRGGNSSCALTMNANKSVIADYSLQQLGLTVTVSAPGSVTGLAAGPCTAGGPTISCLSIVNYGVPVLLQAVPSATTPRGEFVSWTGCTTTSGTNCSVTLTGNRTVAAAFQPIVTSLAIQSTGDNAVPLARGGKRQYSAIATFDDGSTQDVTSRATWTSLNKSVVTVVTTSGLVTGVGFGNTSVTADFQTSPNGSSAHAETAVAADTLAVNGITVDCSPYGEPSGSLACLPSGRSFEVECRATASFGHGGSADVTDQAAWSSTSGSVARFLGLSDFGGPVVASFRISTGTAAVRAAVGTVISSSNLSAANRWVVQGTPLAVTGVTVTPASVTFADDTPVPLTATAALAGTSGTAAGCTAPSTRDFSLLTSWRTVPESSPVADVNVVGVVTPMASGSTTVHWTYPGTSFQGDVPITVP